MSQSDYLKYKKIATQIKIDMSNNEMPVIASQKYIDYKQYSLESTIQNTKLIYNKVTPSNNTIIFDMEVSKTGCPAKITYPVCRNTNSRANRRSMADVYYTPTPQPLTWKQMKNASIQKNGCKCALNSKNTNLYICSCKLGV
jgi:hypothetical protein